MIDAQAIWMNRTPNTSCQSVPEHGRVTIQYFPSAPPHCYELY